MTARIRGLFVVGTDTGVGKTFVSAALCRALRLRDQPVVGFKPYEFGCTPVPQDAEALEREAQSGLPLDLRCPFRFRAAVAPAVAAEREGGGAGASTAARIVRQSAAGRFAIVESAGGLSSPIFGNDTNLELALALGLPVLLVSRNALGTLSQTALAARALRQLRLRIAAIVLSRGLGPRDPSQSTNLAWLTRLTRVSRIVALPRCSLARAAQLLASAID